ncbi:MAG TPA: right-handed parallel beta-helix repeat-containing protein [Fimbriimonadaceae bacterium]|nr:right-handed parallel beta-helix repeat-containing protein [Fimbriimonadaceae bacterium]
MLAVVLAAVLAPGYFIVADPTEDSVANALAEARRLLVDSPVTLQIKSGTVYLSKPLEIGPDLSRLTIEPVRGAKVVFDGGYPGLQWRREQGDVWSLVVPGGAKTRQLFVGGVRAKRAGGYTNPQMLYSMTSIAEQVTKPGDRFAQEAVQTIGVDGSLSTVLSKCSAADIAAADLIVVSKWDDTRRPFQFVDGKIVTSGAGMKSWNSWHTGTKFWIENLPALWNEPGEWIQKPDGKVLYRASAGQLPAAPSVPRINHLLEIKGDSAHPVYNVTLRGLRFEHSTFNIPDGRKEAAQAASNVGSAVTVDYGSNVRFEDCEVGHIGEYAVWFRRACHDCELESCTLYDLGAGGVRIGEPSATDATITSHCLVSNSIVRSGGRLTPCAVGVWIGASPDNTVRFCDISDLYYTGVSIGWRWGYDPSPAKRNHLVSSHIHKIGQGLLSDMGGVYTLGPSEGTSVVGCVFNDVHCSEYGGWGLYTDEGSTGITFQDCLVYDTTSGGFHQHYGKDNVLQNCIFAFARDESLQATRVEDHHSFTIENCIVLADHEPFLAGPWDKLQNTVRGVMWCRLDGAAPTWLGKPRSAWEQMGRVQDWLVAPSPFVDARSHDFRIKPGTDLSLIGFQPFDFGAAGVRTTAMKARLADLQKKDSN